MRYFEFIGITENCCEDLAYFSHIMLKSNSGLAEQKLNQGKHSSRLIPIDAILWNKIEGWHALDMDICQRSLVLREERMNNYSSA